VANSPRSCTGYAGYDTHLPRSADHISHRKPQRTQTEGEPPLTFLSKYLTNLIVKEFAKWTRKCGSEYDGADVSALVPFCPTHCYFTHCHFALLLIS